MIVVIFAVFRSVSSASDPAPRPSLFGHSLTSVDDATISRKRPAAALEVVPDGPNPDVRKALHRQLVQCGTQAGVVSALTQLHAAGALAMGAFKPRTMARELAQAKMDHADTKTPYGRVVQTNELPEEATLLRAWEICHPLALLCHLATCSVPFYNIMEACHARIGHHGMFNIILYIDEFVPSNPHRHDIGRSMQAIYWSLAEWPQWLLARTGAWFFFGVIRSRIVKQLPGKISQLMKLVMYVFFKGADTIQRGILLRSGDGRSMLVRARFGGYLADEKGLKEIFELQRLIRTHTYTATSIRLHVPVVHIPN